MEPCHNKEPSYIMPTLSPMIEAQARLWVMEIPVAPRILTHFTMSWLIRAEVMGSSPVVGSSKSRTEGLGAMVLARAARFFIPPDKDAGYKSAVASFSPTLSKVDNAMG